MKVPVWRVVRLSWQDSYRAARAMPKMMLILFAISCLSAIASLMDSQQVTWKGEAIRLGINIATAVLYAPVLIAIHRYVLVEEVADRFSLALQSRRFRRFFGYSLIVVLFSECPAYAARLAGEDGYSDLILIMGVGISVTAVIWMILVFPAIAIDAPDAGWVASVRRVRGNFWRILAILAAVSLPGLVAMVATLAWELPPVEDFDPPPAEERLAGFGLRTVPVWLIWGMAEASIAVLSAVATSHLYRIVADRR